MAIKAKIVTLENKETGEVLLNEDVFGAPVRKDILHRVVTWQLSRAQSGNHCAKTRSEVRGGKKKPHKQKGTGQARQGSSVAPHMVGGGVAMGPRPRSHALDLPKKIRKLGLKTALSSKLATGHLHVIKDTNLVEFKTSILVRQLKEMGISSVLIIDGAQVDINFRRAVANIVNVDVLPAIGANVYDILRHKNLFITEEAVRNLEERLA